MIRKANRSRARLFRLEGLESRGLLAAGTSSGLNVVMDLGEVSQALATRGVEVIAPIASHGSVTFRFEAEAAGDYLLKVRHLGEGLTLEARGPSGSSSIEPGPAGPFSTIPLSLQAAGYEIKASAVGDQPVFVDWELLLESGVSQSAARGTTFVVSSANLPPANFSATVAPSASSSSSAVSTSTPSASWGQAVSPSMVAVAGPVGRVEADRAISPVGPTSPDGALALAYAGEGLPAGVLMSLETATSRVEAVNSVDSSVQPTSLLTLEVLGDARQDVIALGAATSWFDRLAEWPGQSPTGPMSTPAVDAPAPTSVVVAAAGDPLDGDSEGVTTMTASPGLIASGVIFASVVRRLRPRLRLLAKRSKSPRWSNVLPRSMV